MEIQRYKEIFDGYGGMMRTKELEKEKIRYRMFLTILLGQKRLKILR